MSEASSKAWSEGCVDRRDALAIGAFACLAPVVFPRAARADAAADELPSKGDHLIAGEGDANSPPLLIEAVKVGGEIVTGLAVTPAGQLKDNSRFAKLILFRFDPKDIPEAVRPMTVDGVMAFSAICTHQGCELSAWDPSSEQLRCFCHGSAFLPAKGGEVANGPAVKQLPMLPLSKGEGGRLLVADNFTAQPGPPQKTKL